MKHVVVFGAGQIGRAVHKMILDLWPHNGFNTDSAINSVLVDSSQSNLLLATKNGWRNNVVFDLQSATHEEIVKLLQDESAEYVINALPFSFNEKVASAAAGAKCNYIDFTEDDIMADKVQKIYEGIGLTCAVKCGLAPGFINYVGYNLVGLMDTPDSLMISVGALPRAVSYDALHPENSYNLTWSVDGLVNEYIRPCRVRKDGKLQELPALDGFCKVVIDGTDYEAAYTSGGVGSLARDLVRIPNVSYMTLRYPGHYEYVKKVVQETNGDFEKIRSTFLDVFPFTDDDVIVVYASIVGKDSSGIRTRRVYSNRFYGVDGFTAIQSTTAGSGIAILELMLERKLQGMVNHDNVRLQNFINTSAFKRYYKTSK